MNFLYIGPNSPGGTSSMRAMTLKKLLPDYEFTIIDTTIPFYKSNKIFRSIGFRFKTGPFISALNNYILSNLGNITYNIIWVDKAIFIEPEVTKKMKQQSELLIHYTPDCAFHINSSSLFNRSIEYYNWLISSKIFEKKYYPVDKTLFSTQGIHSNIHKPKFNFEDKYREVVFIGLYEKSRGDVVESLLLSGIKVTVAGKKWKHFKLLKHPNFEYLGEGLFSEEYASTISSSLFSLGLLSKKFPELHTTRTFEIPACGTVLITERNEETSSYFNDKEVIFYNSFTEIPEKIKYYKAHLNELQVMQELSLQKASKYNYESILKDLLVKMGVIV